MLVWLILRVGESGVSPECSQVGQHLGTSLCSLSGLWGTYAEGESTSCIKREQDVQTWRSDLDTKVLVSVVHILKLKQYREG